MLDSIFHQWLSSPIGQLILGDSFGSLHSQIGSSTTINVGVLGLVAAFESVRNYALVLGIGGIAGGILLFINHKKQLDEKLASDLPARVKDYEARKFRRRATVSAMVASVGCMMAALFWVSDAKIYSIFILIILALLIGILGVALVDMLSVGLQQIATPDEKSRKEMIQEYLRKREESAGENKQE